MAKKARKPRTRIPGRGDPKRPPAPVLHLKVPWSDKVVVEECKPGAKVVQDHDGWKLVLRAAAGTMPITMPLTPDGDPVEGGPNPVWVLQRLGGGVYALAPSLVTAQVVITKGKQKYPLHAYVVVYGCPRNLGGYPDRKRKP